MTHCPHCGVATDETGLDSPVHGVCRSALQLEPPRFCPQCGRRMKVQVVPAGWRATCVEHGDLSG